MEHGHMHHPEPIWDIQLLFGFVLISIFYLLLTRYLNNKSEDSRTISKSQIVAFLSACFLFYLTFGSPMAAHNHHYLSVHMLQMSVISFIIPPLLIYSLPYALLKKLVSFLKYPIGGVLFFAFLFCLYHVPPVFDWLMTSHFLHIVSHVILFGAALIMWLPFSPKLANQVLGNSERKYMNFMMWFVMPPCIFLFVMNMELYAMTQVHDHGKIFSNMTDQRLSGAIMILLHQVSMLTNMKANKLEQNAAGMNVAENTRWSS
jgi:cytochrome c oxidase assembly factor CtaG